MDDLPFTASFDDYCRIPIFIHASADVPHKEIKWFYDCVQRHTIFVEQQVDHERKIDVVANIKDDIEFTPNIKAGNSVPMDANMRTSTVEHSVEFTRAFQPITGGTSEWSLRREISHSDQGEQVFYVLPELNALLTHPGACAIIAIGAERHASIYDILPEKSCESNLCLNEVIFQRFIVGCSEELSGIPLDVQNESVYVGFQREPRIAEMKKALDDIYQRCMACIAKQTSSNNSGMKSRTSSDKKVSSDEARQIIRMSGFFLVMNRPEEVSDNLRKAMSSLQEKDWFLSAKGFELLAASQYRLQFQPGGKERRKYLDECIVAMKKALHYYRIGYAKEQLETVVIPICLCFRAFDIIKQFPKLRCRTFFILGELLFFISSCHMRTSGVFNSSFIRSAYYHCASVMKELNFYRKAAFVHYLHENYLEQLYIKYEEAASEATSLHSDTIHERKQSRIKEDILQLALERAQDLALPSSLEDASRKCQPIFLSHLQVKVLQKLLHLASRVSNTDAILYCLFTSLNSLRLSGQYQRKSITKICQMAFSIVMQAASDSPILAPSTPCPPAENLLLITSATPVDIPKELLIYPKDQLFIRAPSVQNPESQPICIAEDTSFALRVDVRNPWPFEIVVSHFRIITTTKWCLNCSVNMPRKIEPNTTSFFDCAGFPMTPGNCSIELLAITTNGFTYFIVPEKLNRLFVAVYPHIPQLEVCVQDDHKIDANTGFIRLRQSLPESRNRFHVVLRNISNVNVDFVDIVVDNKTPGYLSCVSEIEYIHGTNVLSPHQCAIAEISVIPQHSNMNASCRPFESSRIQITVSYGQIQSEMCRRAKIFVSGNYYRPSVAFVRILNPWSEQRILKIGLQNSTNSNILATWKPLETDVRDLSLTSKTQTVTLPPQCVAENHVLSIPCGHVPLSDISRERIEKFVEKRLSWLYIDGIGHRETFCFDNVEIHDLHQCSCIIQFKTEETGQVQNNGAVRLHGILHSPAHIRETFIVTFDTESRVTENAVVLLGRTQLGIHQNQVDTNFTLDVIFLDENVVEQNDLILIARIWDAHHKEGVVLDRWQLSHSGARSVDESA